MRHRSSCALARVIEGLGKLSPPRHRELVRGMVSELDSIADAPERVRFALGAVAAIGRLALSGLSRAAVLGLSRIAGVRNEGDGANLGGPTMPTLSQGQLLRRLARPFAVSLTVLTVLLLANQALRLWPGMSARGVPAGTMAEVMLLALPHTLALTIPMGVFLAVSWAFARLGSEGLLTSAGRERHGVRRLVVPVLAAAAVLGTLTFVSNSQLLPRANARLVEVLQGAPLRGPTDRTMTIGQLREAVHQARTVPGEGGAARAVAYEVEIQKKFALAAACLVLAMAGVGIAFRFPHGGMGLVLGASVLVFAGYYASLVVGEALADRQVISPLLAMWLANALVLGLALLLAWPTSRPDATDGAESLAIGG